jgi:hypothetical protein
MGVHAPRPRQLFRRSQGPEVVELIRGHDEDELRHVRWLARIAAQMRSNAATSRLAAAVSLVATFMLAPSHPVPARVGATADGRLV